MTALETEAAQRLDQLAAIDRELLPDPADRRYWDLLFCEKTFELGIDFPLDEVLA